MKNAARQRTNSASRSSSYSDTLLKWAPLIGGGALALFGLARRTKSGTALAAAGGVVALTAATSAARSRNQETVSSVLVNCTPEEAYQFWRDFENLPRFMHHLDSVQMNGKRSQWTAVGPMGARVRWNAEITEDNDGESIAWRSLPGGDIRVEGSIEFREAPADRGTILFVKLNYSSPASGAATAFAKLFGKDPNFLMRQDLRRFKALMETGEIPTIEGQSHGPRSAKHPLFQALDPDAGWRKPPASDHHTQQQQRRAS